MILTNCIITFYCSCQLCCGPQAKGITASGHKPKEQYTIAAPRWVKLGSHVKINNITYVVQDRTARRYDGRWDIYVKSHNRAKQLGKQTWNVTLLDQ